MTATIKDTVVVNITNETVRFNVADFGTTCILDEITVWTDRVKEFSSPAELLGAGISDTSDVYKNALALMSQARQPEKFLVGRILKNQNAKQKITWSVTPTSGTFKLTFGAEETAAINFDDTFAEIKSALEALTGIAEVTVTTATVGGTTAAAGFNVEFTGADANSEKATFSVTSNSLTPTTVGTVTVISYGSAAESITTGYTAVKEANDKFFGVVITTAFDDTDAYELAQAVEADDRIFAYVSTDATILAATYNSGTPADLPSKLKAASLGHTFCLYSHTSDNKTAAAILGLQLTKTPGSSTYYFRQLAGILVSSFNSTQRANLRSKNCNFYEESNGYNMLQDGVMGDGEFADDTTGIMYLKARLAELVFGTIVPEEKLPYDDPGIDVIKATVFNGLVIYGVGSNLILQSSIVVSAPKAKDVPTADRTARILRNVKFKATLKGGIKKVYIDGSVSY